jgi:hypothetical protein
LATELERDMKGPMEEVLKTKKKRGWNNMVEDGSLMYPRTS